jgi:hypothetical protein
MAYVILAGDHQNCRPRDVPSNAELNNPRGKATPAVNRIALSGLGHAAPLFVRGCNFSSTYGKQPLKPANNVPNNATKR